MASQARVRVAEGGLHAAPHAPSHPPSPLPVRSDAGKTLLAKAVANSTSATFLRVTGSEMVQKYLGEGPKLVREIFRVAEDNAPSIIFIGA